MVMTVNLEQKGLSSVANQFDLFFIDIWGVVHNGIKLYPNAINVLERLSEILNSIPSIIISLIQN